MRIKDLAEAKTQKPIKARDPNWRDMEALRKSGAAGSHKDKTKTIPRKEKYKGKISMEDQFNSYMQEADPDTLGNMNDKMRDMLTKVDQDDKAKAQAQLDKKEAERLAKVKELGDEGMEKYINMLKSHDWTYQYSDDHRYWTKGRDEEDAIRRLGDIVDPDRKLYKKYSPFYDEDITSERSLTKGEEKKKEKYVKGMKKNKKDFKDRYGDDAEAVMYATATKMAKETSDIFKALEQIDETATAGSTSASSIATVTSPHIAYNKKKPKKQKPTDNALDMKGTSIFGGTLKR